MPGRQRTDPSGEQAWREHGAKVAGVKLILIADDDPDLREVIAISLLPLGHLIIQAADGDEAWDMIRKRRPDLAILDVLMPGRDGVALTRAIRKDPELASMRVVLLSGLTSEEAVRAGKCSGADLYLKKPFSPKALRGAVAGLLED